MQVLSRLALSFLLTTFCFSVTRLSATEDGDLYLTEIKPILRKSCYACHGALKQEAGLRVDTAKSLIESGVVEPSSVSNSILIDRISSADPSDRMPPEHEGELLEVEQVELFKTWIRDGAIAPDGEQAEQDPGEHWAFQPITSPSIPKHDSQDSTTNPIDAFVNNKREAIGLTAQPAASRLELIRRVYFDLVGVPPTIDELQQAWTDPTDDWYEQLVDRLLDDPRHGQRWGRHWMDVWRYSDWWGLNEQLRNSQKNIWHWRDWIVESINEDVPYDNMIRLMLAADELYPDDLEKIRATGFLARNYFLFNRNPWMEETVEHVGKGFLGLTMNCAKCHDHKYDPISQTDFYRMRAFFEPYHVRMDLPSDSANLDQDGIPRAFDALLNEPTYRFVRGNEGDPDKTRVIDPGVPSFLKHDPLAIDPVQLPPIAYEPQRRAGVVDAFADAALQAVAPAQVALDTSKQQLDKLQAELSSLPIDSTVDIHQDNDYITNSLPAENDPNWKLLGSGWEWTNTGTLKQNTDGATRSLATYSHEIPNDFEATLSFRILGGSMWRSVGIGYDFGLSRPQDALTENEKQIYVSAVAGGSKVQGSFVSNNAWAYPQNAARSMPVGVDTEIVLTIRVRDNLVNVLVDGEPKLVWNSPGKRNSGGIQFSAFDALVEFESFQVRRLGDDEVMYADFSEFEQATPSTLAGLTRRIEKQTELCKSLTHELNIAKRNAEAVRSRANAWRSIWDDADDQVQQELRQTAAIAVWNLELAKLEKELEEVSQTYEAAPKNEQEKLEAKRTEIEPKISALKTKLDSPDQYLSAFQLEPFIGGKWSATRFRNSGADDPALSFPQTSTGRRTALAKWITDPQNPLTARVAVNQIWMRHMGKPLVDSVFDFGRNGAEPSHPELLDWLASEFMREGWSMKHLHKLIVTSETYRLSSSQKDADPDTLTLDSENRYLWRFEGIRLESQAIRDSVLQHAGQLDCSFGGPPIREEQQPNSKRRSLYFFHSNNERNSFLTAFDEALVKDCYRREVSIVPQQALALTNSRLVLESAEPIAAQIAKHAESETEFIRLAFTSLLGISPSTAELDECQAALQAWNESSTESSEATVQLKARAKLVWVLLNHNDFVTIR